MLAVWISLIHNGLKCRDQILLSGTKKCRVYYYPKSILLLQLSHFTVLSAGTEVRWSHSTCSVTEWLHRTYRFSKALLTNTVLCHKPEK